MVPVPGGVLIKDAQGNIIGAVGVSGDKSPKDEACAIEGIRAAGLRCNALNVRPSTLLLFAAPRYHHIENVLIQV